MRITTRYIEAQSEEMQTIKSTINAEHLTELITPSDLVWAYNSTVSIFETMGATRRIVGFTFRRGQFGRDGYGTYSTITHNHTRHTTETNAKRWIRQEVINA